jgi:hypothetical protein
VYFMKFPLFLDTLFNVSVTFAAGLIPGFVTVLLTYRFTSETAALTLSYFAVLSK